MKICTYSRILVVMVAPTAALAHPGPGIVVDSKERVYFVDYTRDRIMKIDEQGKGSVFVDGAKEDRFHVPHHLCIDSHDNIYTASDRDGKVWRMKPDGSAEQLYPPRDWTGINFAGSGGDPVAVDERGNVFLCNERQDR